MALLVDTATRNREVAHCLSRNLATTTLMPLVKCHTMSFEKYSRDRHSLFKHAHLWFDRRDQGSRSAVL